MEEEVQQVVQRADSKDQDTGYTSKVWENFSISKDDESIVLCSLCSPQAPVSRGNKEKRDYNTSNLRSHLKVYHKIQYDKMLKAEQELEELKQRQKQASSKFLQSSISFQQPVQQYLPSNPKAQKITDSLGYMIAIDNLPFRSVEKTGLVQLLYLLDPLYSVPNRQYFSDVWLPNQYKKCSQNLKVELNDIDHISATTDIWTSNSQRSYLSLTIHYVTQNYIRKNVNLDIRELEEGQTSELILKKFDSMLNDWNIKKKLHLLIRDNCRANEAAFQNAIPNTGCIAHYLQLIINDSINKNKEISDILTKCRKIVSFYHKSSNGQRDLSEAQKLLNLKQKKLIQEISTRWNSTFSMVDRIIEQNMALRQSQSDILKLSNNEIKVLEQMQLILKRFKSITDSLEQDDQTISFVIPLLELTIQEVQQLIVTEKSVKFLQNTIILEFKKRFFTDHKQASSISTLYLLKSKQHIIATALDPRYKSKGRSKDEQEYWRSLLIKEYKDHLINSKISFEKNIDFIYISSIPSKKLKNNESIKEFSLENMLNQFYLTHTNQNNKMIDENDEGLQLQPDEIQQNQSIKQLIDNYLNEEIQPSNSNILNYWKQQSKQFPNLSNLARKFLSAPPTSAPSERFFSQSGDICTEKRNCLKPEKLKQLMLIKSMQQKSNINKK